MTLFKRGESGESPRDTGWQSPMLSLRREVDRAFDWFMQPRWNREELSGPQATWLPPIDLTEAGDETFVRMEVPGMQDGDLELSVSGRTMTISGEKKAPAGQSDEDRCHCERRFGRFKRTIELPDTADVDAIEAVQEDGILTIRVPQKADTASRRIDVKSVSRAPQRVTTAN